MKILCLVGWHRWHKWGGTRTTGLFRQCADCQKKQEGVEGRRCIYWVDVARAGGDAP